MSLQSLTTAVELSTYFKYTSHVNLLLFFISGSKNGIQIIMLLGTAEPYMTIHVEPPPF